MAFWKPGNKITAVRLASWIQSGTVSVSFTSVDSFTTSVAFDYAYDTAPVVFVNVNSGSGSTARWEGRAITVGTTGFTLFLYANAGGDTATWSNIPVQWMAFPQG